MSKQKHTPLDWRIREGRDGDFFIEADKLKPEHAYNVEVMGDDHGGDNYPTEVKRADAEFIIEACNRYYLRLTVLKELHKFINQELLNCEGAKLTPDLASRVRKLEGLEARITTSIGPSK